MGAGGRPQRGAEGDHVGAVQLGEALVERGIHPGDVLIADAAAAAPATGKVAIVMIHGEVLVAQLAFRAGQWWLRAGRRDRSPMPVTEDAEMRTLAQWRSYVAGWKGLHHDHTD